MRLEKLSPENRLIINCARIEMDDEAYNSSLEIIKKGLDWNLVFETAKSHNVAPLMYPNLKILNEEQAIPQNILLQFRKRYHITGIRNSKMYNELAILLKAFKENGIEVMLIKGAALAVLVYKNIALRPMGDVDILIKKEDAEMVKKILIENGYNEDEPLRREYFTELFCALPAYVKEKHTTVEIKWGLFGYFPNGFKPGFNDFVKNSKYITIKDFPVLIPSIQDLQELTYLHVKKHKTNGDQQLLWYCDLAELNKNFRNEIKDEFKNNSNPEEILQKGKNNSKDLYFVSAIFLNIGALNGIYKKFLYGVGCIFPNRKFIIHEYDIKNEKLVYLYYFLRNLRLAFKMINSLLFKINTK